jgi:CubicO group peptidase (beta-lactamase class C family)
MRNLATFMTAVGRDISGGLARLRPSPQQRQVALDKALARLQEEAQFPGFAVAIVSAQGVLYQNAFGWATIEKDLPYTVDTIQPIGSVSKTLIGVALLKAIEHGYFTLESAINDLLPFRVTNPHVRDKSIKVKHLATHTAGIVDQAEHYRQAYVKGVQTDVTLHDFLFAYLHETGRLYGEQNFAKAEPGAAFNYTNIGAALAAYLVEAKTGIAFAEFTQQTILDPLQMNASSWFYDEGKGVHATLYDQQHKPYDPYTLVTYPEGGLRTSCADLSNYLIAMLQGRQGEATLLTTASFQTMFAPQFTPDAMPAQLDPKEPNQGIFWSFRRNGKIGHSGGDPGVSAFLAFDPATGIGKLFMANTELESETLAGQFAQIWSTLEKYEGKLGRKTDSLTTKARRNSFKTS